MTELNWKNLSESSKSVLEWAEDIHTGAPNILRIRAGEAPLRGQRSIPGMRSALSPELVAEISDYARSSPDLVVQQHSGWLLIGFPAAFLATSLPTDGGVPLHG